MAGELEVTFRGMFTLVLPPSHDHARILMPRNDVPTVARGNERYTIPAYEAYVAIPMSAQPTPDPDVICDLPIDHPQVFDRGRVPANGRRLESVTRELRRQNVIPEPEKQRFAIYFASGYEIIVRALRSEIDDLQYDHSPVANNQQPGFGERSVYWLPSPRPSILTAAEEPSGIVQLPTKGDVPPEAAAVIDINTGLLRPRGLVPVHHWRFLHSDNDTFGRAIAQELLVTSITETPARITLRPLAGGADVDITFTPQSGDRVIIGSEPIDDILGSASVQSCAEPAYDFELHYRFFGTRRSHPVPICFEPGDHRSPPGAACGPPIVTGGP